jgi:D-psicose/D-tagatose/L-ribulose 3-epimerase
MRLGMNMLLWSGDVSGAEYQPVFELLADVGFDGVEVPIFALDIATYEALGRRLRDLGLDVLALTARGLAANPIDADPDVRRAGVSENLRALECAHALGASIVCGPFLASPVVFTGAPPTEQEREWAAAAFRTLGEAAEPLGITLAVESLNRFEHYLANTAAETAALCRAADHPRCRMMYDTFHAHLEEKDIAEALAGCADMLAYVHLSENDRSTPGQGLVDWDTTFAALHDIGYDGWLTLEAFGTANAALAAELKLWRRAFTSEEQLVRDGAAFARTSWSRAASRP